MTLDRELLDLLQAPTQRRCWLLVEALRSLPLDRAIELARMAEAFVIGVPGESQIAQPAHTDLKQAVLLDEALKGTPSAMTGQASEPAARPSTRTRLSLSEEQRERLLERMAEGVANAELAREFNLAAKQVQGIRMGSARKIAARRERQTKQATPVEEGQHWAPVDDIVRYLRQQDDVVVPNGDGTYLINARFRLGFADLVDRANKMRRRQGKPEFLSSKLEATNGASHAWVNGHAAL